MSRVQPAEALDLEESAWEEASRQASSEKGTLRERWHTRDTVDQLVDELVSTGRTQEAGIIEAILNRAGGDTDDKLIRAYVTKLWAADWDSDEDAVYDEM